jgi:hypothetical protein
MHVLAYACMCLHMLVCACMCVWLYRLSVFICVRLCSWFCVYCLCAYARLCMHIPACSGQPRIKASAHACTRHTCTQSNNTRMHMRSGACIRAHAGTLLSHGCTQTHIRTNAVRRPHMHTGTYAHMNARAPHARTLSNMLARTLSHIQPHARTWERRCRQCTQAQAMCAQACACSLAPA